MRCDEQESAARFTRRPERAESANGNKFRRKLRDIAFDDELPLRKGAALILADAVMPPAGTMDAETFGKVARFSANWLSVGVWPKEAGRITSHILQVTSALQLCCSTRVPLVSGRKRRPRSGMTMPQHWIAALRGSVRFKRR